MAGGLLQKRDPQALADFIESVLEFAPEGDRAPYLQLVEDVRKGERVPPERLAEAAKNIGAVTWAARRTLQNFVANIGAEIEWEALLDAVRPATALLLKRLKKNLGTTTVDETLAHPDAGLAIHEKEELEISLVRQELAAKLWEEHKAALSTMQEEAETELEAMRKRLKRMRTLANTMPKQGSTVLSKLEALEERIYVDGEAVPLEVLDAEVSFDTADQQVPPDEGMGSG